MNKHYLGNSFVLPTTFVPKTIVWIKKTCPKCGEDVAYPTEGDHNVNSHTHHFKMNGKKCGGVLEC